MNNYCMCEDESTTCASPMCRNRVVELYSNEDGLFEKATDEPVACAWYALCRNQATHLRSHPVLVQVPCCDRCGRKDRLLRAEAGKGEREVTR